MRHPDHIPCRQVATFYVDDRESAEINAPEESSLTLLARLGDGELFLTQESPYYTWAARVRSLERDAIVERIPTSQSRNPARDTRYQSRPFLDLFFTSMWVAHSSMRETTKGECGSIS